MKKHLFPLLSLMILTSCGTSRVLENDISSLKTKVYHLESQNKDLTEKLDKITQQITIQESNLKTVSQELKDVKSDLRKQIVPPVAIPTQTSKSNSAKSTSTKGTTPTKSNSSTVSRSTSTYSGRCQATTEKGTQCKRMAQDGRKYCWQH